MTGVRHHEETPATVEANGHHGGVVDSIEFHHCRLVEIPHETCLLEGGEVLLHQFTKLGAQRRDGAAVPTHISKGNARDDTARTDRDVVHVAPGVTRSRGPGVHPNPQAGQIRGAGGSLVTGPGLGAPQTMWTRHQWQAYRYRSRTCRTEGRHVDLAKTDNALTDVAGAPRLHIGFGGEERAEYPIDVLRVNSCPRICNRHDDGVAFMRLRSHAQNSRFLFSRHGVDGVRDQVK
jgi:hypothetical protein